MRLLLIEDEEVLGRMTSESLVQSGFTVDWFDTGSAGSAAAHAHDYDVILLDLGLPDMPGEAVMEQLRAVRSTTPVIVLTARGQVEDRVAMLDLGADDYLVKPFAMTELCARIRAVKRRVSAGADHNDMLKVGPLELFRNTRSARWKGNPVTITAKEFDLLEALVVRRPAVVSREKLEEAIYGWGEEVESNAVDVYIHFLRRKFSPGLIVTIRGKGYQIGNEELLLLEARRPAAGASQ
ncbi:MAG: response regulator transcription factor [Aquincola sp.]|nr:response regulator transcription factor [Aquincola sp.]MDH5329387.1 response regulator transcription factor [Aquincola sp.]